MKKILALLLALVMVLGLVACGAKEEAPAAQEEAPAVKEEAPAEEAPAEEEGKKYNMTFIMPVRNEFNTAMEAGMLAMCDELSVNLTTQDVNNDSSKIIQFVESARNAGDDAVVVLPVDSETIPQIKEAAGDMKLIIVNRAPANTSIFSGDLVFVGSNENDAGNFQGEYLAQVLKEKGETVAKPIILLGTVGAENTTMRTESAKAALANAGLEVEVVAELAANWDRADAMTKIQPLLTTADYNCIIANNDSMALGAVEALQSVGLDPADVPVVGIDATVDGLDAVEAGTMAMTVFQDAAGQGTGSIIAAINLIEGKSIIDGTDYTVDAENGNLVWIPFIPVYQADVPNFR